jgi:hypothetical protein
MVLKRCLPVLLLLAACSTPPVLPPPLAPAPPVPAAPAGKHLLHIDAERSLITVLVRRGGPLARLGHDHVIASRSISGYVDPLQGVAQFQFRLDQMTVDESALRLEAGLDTQPSSDAIAGTRSNMLGKVLEAERYPVVKLRADRVDGNPRVVRLTVNLHGVIRQFEIPTLIVDKPGEMSATGTLRLRQTNFEIEPMSVLGGAIVVEDMMEMKFHIVARKAAEK